MYEYKGDTYLTLQTLAIVSGIEYRHLHAMNKRAISKGQTLESCIESALNKRKEIEEACTLFEQCFGESVTTINEIKTKLKEEGLTTSLLVGAYSYVEVMQLYIYSKQQGFEWLLTKGKNFEYKGVHYKSLSQFYAHYRIIQSKLFEQLVCNKGDIRLAILHCESDPEFQQRGVVVIQGKEYASLLQASKVLGFSPVYFRKKVREGYTNDEAYVLAVSTHTVENYLEAYFPCCIDGKTYETVDDFLDDMTVRRQTILKNLREGRTLEGVYEIYGKQAPIVKHKGLTFYNKTEMCKHYGVTLKTMRNLEVTYNLTLEQIIDKYEQESVVYEGKTYYSPKRLMDYTGFSLTITNNIWSEMIKQPSNEAREKTLADLISYYRKMVSFLHYKGSTYTTVKEMYTDLGLGKSTMLKYIKESATYEQFESKLDELLKAKHQRAVVYGGEKFSSLYVLSSRTGVSWDMLDKLLDEATSTYDFTDKVNKHISKTKENKQKT